MKCHTNTFDPNREHVYGRDDFCVLCGNIKAKEIKMIKAERDFAINKHIEEMDKAGLDRAQIHNTLEWDYCLAPGEAKMYYDEWEKQNGENNG